MAKKIIILNKTKRQGYFEVSYLFWLAVPANQQALRINASAVSSFKQATTEETTALQNGSVLEQVGITSYALATTDADIASDLQTKYNTAQTALNSTDEFHYYGTYWDGSNWTMQEVG